MTTRPGHCTQKSIIMSCVSSAHILTCYRLYHSWHVGARHICLYGLCQVCCHLVIWFALTFGAVRLFMVMKRGDSNEEKTMPYSNLAGFILRTFHVVVVDSEADFAFSGYTFISSVYFDEQTTLP